MSPLTRENLAAGTLRRLLPLPEQLAWTEAQVAQSFADTWAQRPDDGPVWVFAYGSLIWNPLIVVEAEACATLHGWRRSFCLQSVVGRGCPERPGRMLSLQPGGHTQGVALRLPPGQAEQELRLLWAREMAMGSYRPTWVRLDLHQGADSAWAIAFVANPEHGQHQADDSVAAVAGAVARASGAFGRNIDYLHALAGALAARGLHDDYIAAIVQAVADASERA